MAETENHPRRWWYPIVLAAVLGSVFGIPAAWARDDTLPNSVCRSSFGGLKILQRAVADLPRCDGARRRLQPIAASKFLARYLGMASGANPAEGWADLTSELQDSEDEGSYVAAWQPMLWAEQKGEATEGSGFNDFVVNYRAYYGDGVTDARNVNHGYSVDRRLEVRLTMVDGDIRIAEIIDARNLGRPIARRYPNARATRDHLIARVLPFTKASPTGAVDIRRGSLEPVLCYVETPRGSGRFWFRTRLGWVDGKDFALQSDVGRRRCSNIYASPTTY